jgi:hypothetical protein
VEGCKKKKKKKWPALGTIMETIQLPVKGCKKGLFSALVGL